jgi:hypothetical protein
MPVGLRLTVAPPIVPRLLPRLFTSQRKAAMSVLNSARYSAAAFAGSRSISWSITDCGTEGFITRVGAFQIVENDNNAIDAVVKTWAAIQRRIADTTAPVRGNSCARPPMKPCTTTLRMAARSHAFGWRGQLCDAHAGIGRRFSTSRPEPSIRGAVIHSGRSVRNCHRYSDIPN